MGARVNFIYRVLRNECFAVVVVVKDVTSCASGKCEDTVLVSEVVVVAHVDEVEDPTPHNSDRLGVQ